MPVSDAGYPHGGFGDRLRRDREAAGLTQEELAEKTGLSVRAISNIERGRTAAPRPSSLRLIARALTLTAEHAGPVGGPAPGSGTPSRWPVSQLPAAPADLTGRREQTLQLTQLLAAAGDGQAPGAVVLAVVGTGGIGKSALAVHVAQRAAAHFPDGQLYLDLRGRGPRQVAPVDALAQFLRDLGGGLAARYGTEAELAARYRSLLAGLRLLIVLDDARDAAQVRPLLPGTGRCAVVITAGTACWTWNPRGSWNWRRWPMRRRWPCLPASSDPGWRPSPLLSGTCSPPASRVASRDTHCGGSPGRATAVADRGSGEQARRRAQPGERTASRRPGGSRQLRGWVRRRAFRHRTRLRGARSCVPAA